jgi:RNA polymerase sigma factor (sigma-70 family)
MDPLLADRLQKTLRGLAPVERVALVLRYQEELDAAAIGKVLGLSSDAVNKHLRRALARLKVRLSGTARPQSAQAACEPQD